MKQDIYAGEYNGNKIFFNKAVRIPRKWAPKKSQKWFCFLLQNEVTEVLRIIPYQTRKELDKMIEEVKEISGLKNFSIHRTPPLYPFFVLPKYFTEISGDEKEVVFIGMLKCIEIWNKTSYKNFLNDDIWKVVEDLEREMEECGLSWEDS